MRSEKRNENLLPSFIQKPRAVISSQSPFTANIIPKISCRGNVP